MSEICERCRSTIAEFSAKKTLAGHPVHKEAGVCIGVIDARLKQMIPRDKWTVSHDDTADREERCGFIDKTVVMRADSLCSGCGIEDTHEGKSSLRLKIKRGERRLHLDLSATTALVRAKLARAEAELSNINRQLRKATL